MQINYTRDYFVLFIVIIKLVSFDQNSFNLSTGLLILQKPVKTTSYVILIGYS